MSGYKKKRKEAGCFLYSDLLVTVARVGWDMTALPFHAIVIRAVFTIVAIHGLVHTITIFAAILGAAVAVLAVAVISALVLAVFLARTHLPPEPLRILLKVVLVAALDVGTLAINHAEPEMSVAVAKVIVSEVPACCFVAVVSLTAHAVVAAATLGFPETQVIFVHIVLIAAVDFATLAVDHAVAQQRVMIAAMAPIVLADVSASGT